ncbi:MAG TPA: MATE family efflux transporter [Polyangiaceae bacterium]|nr:MATE family efflux transporter [Polyangiaceae bacterium]
MSVQPLSPAKEGPSLGSLLGLAWPIVLTRATQSVIGFTDALMVAPLGEDTLAAVTTGALNCFAVIILPMGTVFILQSFAAQLRGRGEMDKLPRFAWYGLGLALFFGLAALAAIPLVPAVLDRFAYSPAVRHLMGEYVTIRLLSVGAAVGSEALSNWYGGIGNTRVGMIGSVVAMLANLVGCFLLIEPRFGLPGYGVQGAGWASVIASWLGFAVVAFAFLRGLGYERVRGRLGLSLRELWRVLRFGLPNGVNWFFEFAAFVLFINVVVAHLGTTVLAAFNVVMQVNSISFMPAFGLSSAGAIFVGEAIGRGKHDAVWPIVRLTGAVAATWMISVGVLYCVLPETLVSLFQPRGAEASSLVSIGTSMLMLSALWQLADAINLVLSEALRAAGDTAWCMGARQVLAWVMFPPADCISVLVLDGGVHTVMFALIGYLVALATTFALRFASGRWRHIDLVGSETKLA